MSTNIDDDDFDSIDDVYIKNDHGEYIVYDSAIKDLDNIELEFHKIGSYYIDKFEILPRSEEPSKQGI